MQSGWWNRAMPGTTRTSVSALALVPLSPDWPRSSSVAAAPVLAAPVLAASVPAAPVLAASVLAASAPAAAAGADSAAPSAAAVVAPVLRGGTPVGDRGVSPAGAVSPVSRLPVADAGPAAAVAARGGNDDPARVLGRAGSGATVSAGVSGRSLVAGPVAGGAHVTDDDPAGSGPASGSA
jgi:hypothetical protein